MKNTFLSLVILFVLGFSTNSFAKGGEENKCTCDKDKMEVVMRFEIKVLPEKVEFLKQSWDECRAQVLAKEPGCIDYSLFQSYNDSTLFVINEAWKTKKDHNDHMKLAHTQKHITETRDIRDRTFKAKTNYLYWICPEANAKK
jgi:quinol monooxygenase YgiN